MKLREHRTRPGCRVSSLDALADLEVVKVLRRRLKFRNWRLRDPHNL